MATTKDLKRALRAVPPAVLARGIARAPLELQAARLIEALPTVELVAVTGPATFQISLATVSSRHEWSLGVAEQVVLQAIVSGRGVSSAFEIGTFNGGTTCVLAEALPPDGRVVTIDLPPAEFDATQSPRNFAGADVGSVYRGSPAAAKVTQLLVDSLNFDSSPYAGRYDLVLVDGGHEYAHGVADTRTALRVVARGGVIVWDDFTPYWHGLVRGICREMRGRNLSRLAGTALAVHVNGAVPQ
jgi:predicted O-methyltransferase YrrM